jgi:hypothetical protein
MQINSFLAALAVFLPIVYGAPTTAANSLHPEILAAMKRDLGLDAEQAHVRVARELQAAEVIEQLRTKAGNSFAGAWLVDGDLKVAVTDEALMSPLPVPSPLSLLSLSPSSRRLRRHLTSWTSLKSLVSAPRLLMELRHTMSMSLPTSSYWKHFPPVLLRLRSWPSRSASQSPNSKSAPFRLCRPPSRPSAVVTHTLSTKQPDALSVSLSPVASSRLATAVRPVAGPLPPAGPLLVLSLDQSSQEMATTATFAAPVETPSVEGSTTTAVELFPCQAAPLPPPEPASAALAPPLASTAALSAPSAQQSTTLKVVSLVSPRPMFAPSPVTLAVPSTLAPKLRVLHLEALATAAAAEQLTSSLSTRFFRPMALLLPVVK